MMCAPITIGLRPLLYVFLISLFPFMNSTSLGAEIYLKSPGDLSEEMEDSIKVDQDSPSADENEAEASSLKPPTEIKVQIVIPKAEGDTP